MAHVQEEASETDSRFAAVAAAAAGQTCRRLRPRGRQRSINGRQRINGGQALFWLLAVFQLANLVSVTAAAPAGQEQGQQRVHNATAAAPSTGQDNAASVASSAWRRMGLSEAVTNNEQELINKILRDDTSSSGAGTAAGGKGNFHYTRPLGATTLAPPSGATKSDTERLSLPTESSSSSSSSSSAGKINQSRSKEEQQAFNRRLANVSQDQREQEQEKLQRSRRDVNVVVNTFNSKVLEGDEPLDGSSDRSSDHSYFLLKSIVTRIADCLKNKCRKNSQTLTTSDIPQLLRLVASNETMSTVHVLDLSDSGFRSLPHRTLQAVEEKLPAVGFIDLSVNQLKEANLALSGPVEFLNFSQNQLTRFRLRGNASVAYLDLSRNNLTGDPAFVLGEDGNCANLTLLDVSGNRLRDLQFLSSSRHPHCPVRVLNVAHNQVRRIKRDTFLGTRHLEILSLAHNLVAEIENDTFGQLQRLQYLDLSDNRLNGSSVRALQGIPDLIGLSLARNPDLGDAALQGFVASWSLKELDISGTGLCEIPAALAQSVRTLNLAHNNFQVCMIRMKSLTKLLPSPCVCPALPPSAHIH